MNRRTLLKSAVAGIALPASVPRLGAGGGASFADPLGDLLRARRNRPIQITANEGAVDLVDLNNYLTVRGILIESIVWLGPPEGRIVIRTACQGRTDTLIRIGEDRVVAWIRPSPQRRSLDIPRSHPSLAAIKIPNLATLRSDSKLTLAQGPLLARGRRPVSLDC